MAMPVSHFSASAGSMGSCNFLFCFLRALGQSSNRCHTTSGREATSWRICVGVRCFLDAGHGGIINLGVDSPCHTSESLCTRLFLDNKNHSGAYSRLQMDIMTASSIWIRSSLCIYIKTLLCVFPILREKYQPNSYFDLYIFAINLNSLEIIRFVRFSSYRVGLNFISCTNFT